MNDLEFATPLFHVSKPVPSCLQATGNWAQGQMVGNRWNQRALEMLLAKLPGPNCPRQLRQLPAGGHVAGHTSSRNHSHVDFRRKGKNTARSAQSSVLHGLKVGYV